MERKNSGGGVPGRPRSEASRQAILGAVISLLEEVDYSLVTMESIAAKAGVSKATIYRWWKDRSLLTIDAFLMRIDKPAHLDGAMSLRDMFLQQLTGIAEVFNSGIGRTVLAIVSSSAPDSEQVKWFHDGYLIPRRTEARHALQRALSENDVRKDIDVDAVLDMLYGPVYLRVLIHKSKVDAAYIRTIVDAVMDWLAAD